MTKLKKYIAIFAGNSSEDFYTISLKNAQEFADKQAKRKGLEVVEVFTTD